MEGILSSIREGMEGGKLPSVVGQRRLEQSLFFPVLRCHPRSAALDDAVLGAWATAYGGVWAADIDQMRALKIASLAAYLWPTCAEDKRTMTLIKLMQWFFLVDDAFGELHNSLRAHRLCEQLIHDTFEPGLSCPLPMVCAATASGYIHEKQPLITAVGLEWWQEMKQSVSITQATRFKEVLCEYLRQQAREVEFKERLLRSSKLPDVEEYILMRRESSGMRVCIAMVEYDVGIELEKEKLRNPQMLQLQEGICDITCWLNDIFSFPRELAQGELLSLLPVLHAHSINNALHNEKTTVRFEEAVSQAWRMIEAQEEKCAGLAHALKRREHSSPSFHRYVDTMCGITSGSWAWNAECVRYKVPTSNMTPKIGFSRNPSQRSPTLTHFSPYKGFSPTFTRLGGSNINPATKNMSSLYKGISRPLVYSLA